MNPLQQAIEDAGYKTRPYSGRGMCGTECLGVSTNDGEATFATNVIAASNGTRNIVHLLRHMCSDSLGKGSIFYFPSIPFKESKP